MFCNIRSFIWITGVTHFIHDWYAAELDYQFFFFSKATYKYSHRIYQVEFLMKGYDSAAALHHDVHLCKDDSVPL